MGIWNWLFRFNRPKPPESERAKELSVSIARKSEEIQANLRVYQRAKDPFGAMMADLYNKDQLSRVHLNGQARRL